MNSNDRLSGLGSTGVETFSFLVAMEEGRFLSEKLRVNIKKCDFFQKLVDK